MLGVVGVRIRVLVSRALEAFGFRDDAFLLFIAALVGLITAAAAVGFHLLICYIRDRLYTSWDPRLLYGPGAVILLILWPALGGLAVGVISRWIFRSREGHGVVDVMESIIRSRGFIRPVKAVERIASSALTIGSGGSAGAEGPIVQIGAAIASGFGQTFRLTRAQMPLIIGCGAAAGISAIFNSPMGGLLFTLEVLLLDFSLRSVTPVIIASVIANVSTQAIFQRFLDEPQGLSIFRLPEVHLAIAWQHIPNFAVLGLVAALIAVTLTRLMNMTEQWFGSLRMNPAVRPAFGGALLGVIGVFYVAVFGWIALKRPIPVEQGVYSMPAFFGDGYPFIQLLLTSDFYSRFALPYALCLLVFLVAAKLVGTCLTIGSGGAGGIIAPSLFLGAAAGGGLGLILKQLPFLSSIEPHVYALVGMGAVLAAVVHAPLSAIVILLELTHDYQLALPAMLATVTATAVAKRMFRDSIYTLGLRARGIQTGGSTDHLMLRRMHVEQVRLEPATLLEPTDSLKDVIDRNAPMGVSNFAVIDKQGFYVGMVVDSDLYTALMQREALPLLLVKELVRKDIPFVRSTDDLAAVLDVFSRHEVDYLPVCLDTAPGKVIGLISRAGLMRAYQLKLTE